MPGQFGGHLEHHRARLIGLADDLGDGHLVIGALRAHGGNTSTRPPATASSMLSRKLAPVGISAEAPPALTNSADPNRAASGHCTLVCCRLNWTTRTHTPHCAHSTGVNRQGRSSAATPVFTRAPLATLCAPARGDITSRLRGSPGFDVELMRL